MKRHTAAFNFVIIAAVICVVVPLGMATDGTKPLETVLKDSNGKEVGTARFTETRDGVQLNVDVKGISPGLHGIHVHEVAKCEAPDFKTAGGHLNPQKKSHGLDTKKGPHAGDLPNLVVKEDGTGQLQYTSKHLKIQGGKGSLLEKGAAMVIHATADDQKTDPAGDSGGRIACGVISKK